MGYWRTSRLLGSPVAEPVDHTAAAVEGSYQRPTEERQEDHRGGDHDEQGQIPSFDRAVGNRGSGGTGPKGDEDNSMAQPLSEIRAAGD